MRLSFPDLLVALSALWLPCNHGAALDWTALGEHRVAHLSVPQVGKPGFSLISPAAAGINFTNRLDEERSLTNQVFLNGSGVAAGDFDGDGWCDLYFCGLEGGNALYRNLGNWKFEEVTARAGVECRGQASTGALFADVDGDGDLDLLVSGIHAGTRLFLNDGKGKFTEATDLAGLRSSRGGTSLAMADVNGDGFLDLYTVNYRSDTIRDMPDLRYRFGTTNGVYQLLSVNGQSADSPSLAGRFSFDRTSGVLENGEPDTLFLNDGHGRFLAQSWTNGVFLDEAGRTSSIPYDWGLSAMFRDLDGDGAPDLYVCNDFQSPDRIWMNDGHGRFRALPRGAIRRTSLFSMGMDVADVDRDGRDDIFVADMLSREHVRRQVQLMDATAFTQYRNGLDGRPQIPRNTLLHNRGDGTYEEIAPLAGLEASDWSWCPVFLDVDLDGYEDLLVTTGHWRDAQNVDVAREIDALEKQKPLTALEKLRLRRRFPRLATPNAAFRNRCDLTFAETGQDWGFDSRRVSHGLALADLDNDGDLDVVVNCLNDGPLLYRNEASNPRVQIRLAGRTPNTAGTGARITVWAPGLPAQSQEMISGGRYLSGDQAVRTFAAGAATNRLRMEVAWRGGGRTTLQEMEANTIIEVREPAGSTPPAPASPPNPVNPWFEDLSQLLRHQHRDDAFDDFAAQPLLPHRLSDLGPSVAWFDFNRDGWDDLLIGSGRGGKMAAFRNDGRGGFIPQRARILEDACAGAMSAVLGWLPSATNVMLVLGGARPGETPAEMAAFRTVSLVSGEVADGPVGPAITGPIALGDVAGEGRLSMFVGGRFIPGRFPIAASSMLLHDRAGRMIEDERNREALRGVGMVSGAVFSDLDGDGRPDLIIACEWGSLIVFRNDSGLLQRWNAPLRWPDGTPGTPPASLDQLTGWWNSIVAGDFDGDGRMDLAAGNWGRNTSRQRHLAQPLRLYYGTAETSEGLGLIEAHAEGTPGRYVPTRDLTVLGQLFPTLHEKFPTHASFAEAGIEDLRAAGLVLTGQVSAVTLDSLVLLNRGDHFLARAMPTAAQVAPVFGLAVGDLNGDGTEDLFLAQNYSGVPASEATMAEGVGLWLRGDGQGGFLPVSTTESGFRLEADGRGAALCDYDHDGRLDVVVGQHGGETKLLHNRRGRPGLRIRLEGPEGNAAAVGALVRLRLRDGTSGPAHESSLGGGYWSQAGAEIVLGASQPIAGVWVRWPDGTVAEQALANGQASVTLHWNRTGR